MILLFANIRLNSTGEWSLYSELTFGCGLIVIGTVEFGSPNLCISTIIITIIIISGAENVTARKTE
jgi:hypothetical protein